MTFVVDQFSFPAFPRLPLPTCPQQFKSSTYKLSWLNFSLPSTSGLSIHPQPVCHLKLRACDFLCAASLDCCMRHCILWLACGLPCAQLYNRHPIHTSQSFSINCNLTSFIKLTRRKAIWLAVRQLFIHGTIRHRQSLTGTTVGVLFAGLSLFFVAGAVLLILLTLLGGAVDSGGLNKIHFLQADTSDIPNAGDTTRWTYWSYCDSDSSSAPSSCNGISPAFPLDPPGGRTFDTEDNIPEQFLNTNKFFLMSRFMFAFVLIALAFAVIALFTSVLGLCTRIGALLAGFMSMVAMFFQALAAILMT